ncbi:hypothetical protein Q3G72_021195 [Acer saccharum]|nr:hypothetical protein Q3G72_021195 [Acer saccharum]
MTWQAASNVRGKYHCHKQISKKKPRDAETWISKHTTIRVLNLCQNIVDILGPAETETDTAIRLANSV